MLKVLFDLRVTQPMNGDKRHGGGKYGEIVLKRIVERNLPVCCSYDSTVWLNPDIKLLIEKNGIELYDLSEKTYDEIVKESGASLIFESSNLNGKFWSKINCKVLGVIHGLRGLELPLDSYEFKYKQPLKNVIKSVLKRVSKRVRLIRQKAFVKSSLEAENISILTVSHHSAAAFRVFFPEYKKNIPVFYSPSTSFLETKNRVYNDKYFLLVSANRPMKNNLRAIIALDRLFSNGQASDFRVKVTGIKDAKIFKYKIKNPERFDFLGYVDEQELDQLYHDAYCFIYPTLNEGFGYPPLEAMHYGVPVLTSANTAVPEVCGGSVIYFNPFSVEEIMNRIIQIIDKDIHEDYSIMAKDRYDIITKQQNQDLDRLIDYIYSFK